MHSSEHKYLNVHRALEPESIIKVIFLPEQFTPVPNDKVARVIDRFLVLRTGG